MHSPVETLQFLVKAKVRPSQFEGITLDTYLQQCWFVSLSPHDCQEVSEAIWKDKSLSGNG